MNKTILIYSIEVAEHHGENRDAREVIEELAHI